MSSISFDASLNFINYDYALLKLSPNSEIAQNSGNSFFNPGSGFLLSDYSDSDESGLDDYAASQAELFNNRVDDEYHFTASYDRELDTFTFTYPSSGEEVTVDREEGLRMIGCSGQDFVESFREHLKKQLDW